MPIKKLRIKQRFKFFLERQFVKGAHYQLLFAAALIGLISIIGGMLVLPSGSPTDDLGEAIWWAFLRLSDPGYLGDDEGIWRRFISTLITLAGYVVFLGSLVAIITTWLNRKIRNLEQGLTPVAADNHVIILGWTNRTIHIASEIFQSVGRLRRFLERYGKRNLQLIILSDDVTPDHLQELRDNPGIGSRADEIILRSGIAIDREHLMRVDSMNASAIIIPSQSYAAKELITPDVETIKALLSLNAESYKRDINDRPYVVAEIQDENKLKAAYQAYSGPLEVIGSNTIISRLLAQNIRHHGLSEIYNELLSRSVKNNLFAQEYPEAVGRSIGQLKKAFPKAILLGVVRVENDAFVPMLNLAGHFVVEQNDRLVLMARHLDDIQFKGIRPEDPLEEIKGSLPVEERTQTKKVLILGWNHHIPALIKEFGTYEGESYHITIAALRSLEDRRKELEDIEKDSDRVVLEQIEADFVKESELRKIDPARFDNILLVSSDRFVEEEEADARTIVGYVLLEDLLEEAPTRPQILLELSDPSNESLIRRFDSEVIIGPMILSHLLAAIALRRELYSIYNELFTVGGAEIIFRDLEEYGLEAGTIPFGELEKQAAEYNEIALGIYTEHAQGNRKVVLTLNPESHQKLHLNENVQLVVLTTIY
ncbi:MAG: hypothetical protein R3350_09770 [Saprospiraceae bacterium]|nr:hypothetical protein [Saprospiraceae bacterium]